MQKPRTLQYQTSLLAELRSEPYRRVELHNPAGKTRNMPRKRYTPSDVESRCDPSTYRDLRSHKRIRNRLAKQSQKYYGYRGVDPNWVGQDYLALPASWVSRPSWTYDYPNVWASMDPLVTSEADLLQKQTWTKRDMWQDREQNIWPLDRRHHVGKRKREKSCSKWDELALGRRMKQREKEWGLLADEGRAARIYDDCDCDVDTIWWDLEPFWYDEVLDADDEQLPTQMDLEGRRIPRQPPWDDHSSFTEWYWEEGTRLGQDDPDEWWEVSTDYTTRLWEDLWADDDEFDFPDDQREEISNYTELLWDPRSFKSQDTFGAAGDLWDQNSEFVERAWSACSWEVPDVQPVLVEEDDFVVIHEETRTETETETLTRW
jgi:hypothetical protein